MVETRRNLGSGVTARPPHAANPVGASRNKESGASFAKAPLATFPSPARAGDLKTYPMSTNRR
jgi:hypothetical protein